MITVAPGDPRHPDAVRLLQASHALMEASFPAESSHYLSIDDLCVADVRFFHGMVNGRVLGTGAIKLYPDYAEVKSMFTDEAARGQGLADAILSALTDTARAEGKGLMRLETGNILYAAHRLYARHGFVERGPFGDYPDDPNSLFMEKVL